MLFLSPNLEKKMNSHQHQLNQTTEKCEGKKKPHSTDIRYLIHYEMSFQAVTPTFSVRCTYALVILSNAEQNKYLHYTKFIRNYNLGFSA